MTTSTERQELVVVTGAATGMGAATARELARRGFLVLAGVRRPRDAEAIRAAGIEPVILDITDPDQIAALAARINTDPQRRPLRALVNNAGTTSHAPVEALPMSEWRQMFEVNLFGHIAMTQALLPALLRSHGRVVNISSIAGKVALPAYGSYAAAKHALEAVSDSLRREVAPYGVSVVVVEPGGVKTEGSDRAAANANHLATQMTPEQDERYGPLMRAIVSHAAAFTEAGKSAEQAAQVIVRATTDRKPRTRYTVGRDAAMLTRLCRILPDRTLDRILRADLRSHYPTAAAPARTRARSK